MRGRGETHAMSPLTYCCRGMFSLTCCGGGGGGMLVVSLATRASQGPRVQLMYLETFTVWTFSPSRTHFHHQDHIVENNMVIFSFYHHQEPWQNQQNCP